REPVPPGARGARGGRAPLRREVALWTLWAPALPAARSPARCSRRPSPRARPSAPPPASPRQRANVSRQGRGRTARVGSRLQELVAAPGRTHDDTLRRSPAFAPAAGGLGVGRDRCAGRAAAI